MPRLRLPPLPPYSSWSTYFPRRYLPRPPDAQLREFPGRTLLASRKLADEFVRSLKLREGEVVVDVNSGVGVLTRSLLAGGKNEVQEEWTEEDVNAAKQAGKDASLRIEEGITAEIFPAWGKELLQGVKQVEDPVPSEDEQDAPKPSLVVASEPSPEFIVRAFGLAHELAKPKSLTIPSTLYGDEVKAVNLAELEGIEHPTRIYQSAHEPRLLLSPSSAYRWNTLTNILSNPLVAPHLPVHGPAAAPGSETTKRAWSAPPPPITIVAQVPDSVVGEQMVAQWVGSSVGDERTPRSWIWEWGRVRLALLVGKGLYDRMMAKPGETINCKLSILTSALFNMRALPPYHHVPNVDKSSKATEGRPIEKSRRSRRPPPQLPLPGSDLPRTITYPSDFYPSPRGMSRTSAQLSRPALLGILLEPKADSVITLDQKDEWDYVLRKCFTREAQSIREALKNVGFGGEALADRLSAPNGYKGRPLEGSKIVRDLDVAEWARVVDVFDKWAFKPENLILDSRIEEDLNREVGQD